MTVLANIEYSILYEFLNSTESGMRTGREGRIRSCIERSGVIIRPNRNRG